jgi:hypothetical protein
MLDTDYPLQSAKTLHRIKGLRAISEGVDRRALHHLKAQVMRYSERTCEGSLGFRNIRPWREWGSVGEKGGLLRDLSGVEQTVLR